MKVRTGLPSKHTKRNSRADDTVSFPHHMPKCVALNKSSVVRDLFQPKYFSLDMNRIELLTVMSLLLISISAIIFSLDVQGVANTPFS